MFEPSHSQTKAELIAVFEEEITPHKAIIREFLAEQKERAHQAAALEKAAIKKVKETMVARSSSGGEGSASKRHGGKGGDGAAGRAE